MRIWIDLANSPHVPFFRPLADQFLTYGHEVTVTAREFAETVPLAIAAGFSPEIIGGHGGGKLPRKAGNIMGRALSLARWARGKHIDLAVSHNSYSQIVASRALGIKTVTLMDYEHQPANHLAFRLASKVIVPKSFPDAALNRFGVSAKVRKYEGIKEDVYLASFVPDPNFPRQLEELAVQPSDVLIVARPPASEALYHRFENELFDRLLDRLQEQAGVKVILLPRNESQREFYRQRHVIIPHSPLDGSNLIAHSDLVVSAGGTMNREAAALGIPAISIYLGEWAAIDQQLVDAGRLKRITAQSDFDQLIVQKKQSFGSRARESVLRQVTNLILED